MKGRPPLLLLTDLFFNGSIYWKALNEEEQWLLQKFKKFTTYLNHLLTSLLSETAITNLFLVKYFDSLNFF